MGKTNFNETKAFLRLVMGTLTILGILTAINILMIMNSLGTNLFKPLQRNIASVTPIAKEAPEEVFSPIIEINCHKKLNTLRVHTKASSARVFFKNCKNIGRLTNESNKNQGDVFHIKGAQWTSDFISLDEGKNSIKAPLGDQVQVIEITREETRKADQQKAL